MKTPAWLFPAALTALSLPAAAALPRSAELHYTGNYGIPADMTFTQNGSRYTVVSRIQVPLYAIRFEAGGTVSGKRLIPAYYQDVRGGKTYAEARFGSGSIRYGKAGSPKTEAVRGPVMDLFSLAWQFAAAEGKLPAGLKLTNGKKLYRTGKLAAEGSGRYTAAGRSTAVRQYRFQQGSHTVRYALSPELGHLPVRIRYTDNGKTYDLKLARATVNGQTVFP